MTYEDSHELDKMHAKTTAEDLQNGLTQLDHTKLHKLTAFKEEGFCIDQNDAISYLKSLPDESVDLIITDPAYSGMNQMLKLGSGKIIGTYKNKGDGQKWFEEFHDTEENYNELLGQCYRVLKNDRHIYIMFDSYSLLTLGPLVRSVFNVKNIIVWDKINIGMGHYYRRRHEFIIFASKGKKSIESRSMPDIWRVKRIVKSKYPTQKPTEIFELMVINSTEPGFVVCDPFMGSGSAAIAAIKHGCKFYGCDISLNSVKITYDRIREFERTGIDILQPYNCIEGSEKYAGVLYNGKS